MRALGPLTCALLVACGTSGPSTTSVATVNGCASTDYVDLSATTADRRIGFGTALGSPAVGYAPACARIAVGQSVTFVGDFSVHPLAPGDDKGDAGSPNNPIPRKGTGSDDAAVPFAVAGLYPFYCEAHEPIMAGAVLVQ